MWDRLYLDCRLATMERGGAPYGAIDSAALGVAGGKLAYVGTAADLPGRPEALASTVERLDGRWITPGLVDCHTHLVYGGNRAREFELRLEGATYEEIAKAGGGIVSTVAATRQASEDELIQAALRRLDELLAEGVTTIEIKSGYGLDLDNELKMLRVARRLGELRAVTVSTSFLGLHAVPPEYKGRQAEYAAAVVAMLPAVAKSGLADTVDGFCERIAFTAAETEALFQAAKRLGLPVKLHAEQLSDMGGAQLVARYGGLSADHLEYVSDEGIAAMAKAGTVAVVLPGAFYFLREKQLPPIEKLRQAGVPIALATDSNPGSSPVTSILLMLNMAATLFRMTPEEALAGITRNSARALGLAETHGTLAAGKVADLCVWDIETPAELSYRIGANPLAFAVHGGTRR
ncbi:MAG TPA: imidazolonepropionase [Kiloniellales bacterium]|nr:imidazolonepropionase [Kiloniellales bacterium]